METTDHILAALPRYREAARARREVLLADLSMIGEVPALTFGEAARSELLLGRFAESGLQDCMMDGLGNVSGVLPGSDGSRNLLLATNVDTIVKNLKDQTVEIATERVVGPFVGDNCLALAALCFLPGLMENLQIRLRSNLVMVAGTRTLGRGNLEGLRSFLSANRRPLAAGLCLESVQLGRLNYACIGMLRAEILCRLPDDYNWAQFGATGTIIPMSDIINRISRIPLPRRPLTTMIMGSVTGGISHNNIARETRLCFELRSEDQEIIRQIHEQIEDITEEVTAQSGIRASLEVVARRDPGGLDISHPLVRSARAVLGALGVQPQLYATTSMLSALRDAGIPGVTLGITCGERKSELDEIDEAVAIEPMATGVAQIVGILQAVDGGSP